MVDQDEVVVCAKRGDIDGLQAAMKRPGTRPQGKACEVALVFAADNNQVNAVKLLLAAGVSAKATDENQRTGLHAAAQKGFADVARMLVKKGADFKALDSDGRKALDAAISQKHLAVIKVLLRAGDKLKPDQTCKGLDAVKKEVQLEFLLNDLKAYASPTDFATELSEADSAVWEAQKAQMRLCEAKEEQKAGHTVVQLESSLEAEMELYEQMKNSEDSVQKELKDLRVSVQTVESDHGLLKSKLEAAEVAAKEAAEIQAEGEIEYKALLAELKKLESEKEEADGEIAAKESERDNAQSIAQELKEEANAMKLRNKDLSEQLKSESAQLRGWERDKEAAAELTAQAHAILGVPSPTNRRQPNEPLV